jgi:Uma2 family endonuclease
MSIARRLHHTYEAYLEALEMSPIKLEYLEGEIFAMAGGTPTHADLAAAMIAALTRALSEGCRVSTSDLKVRVEATDLSTFPDVSVTCGARLTSPIDHNAVTNPTLLVEVTSESTEEYDRGEKLRHYKHLESLEAVLFVSHRRPEITVVERTAGVWQERVVGTGEHVILRKPTLRFAVDDLYRGIELEGAT